MLTVVGLVGDTVTLPCEYDVGHYGLLNVCWGRDQSWFSCEHTLIATDGLTVNYRQSNRYSLPTKLQHGDVSLTIKKAQKTDTGFYVCRIEIPGLFNDLSYSFYLIITNGFNTINNLTKLFPTSAEKQMQVCPCRGINIAGFSGQKVTLPCEYNFKYHGKCEICWMRGDIPTLGCGNEIIASDGDKAVRQTSPRYQLDGELQKGDASLTIHNTTLEDSGRYGCRVHVPGLFNDEKIIIDLVIMIGPTSEVNSLSPNTPELVTEPTHVTSASTRHYSNTSSPETNKIDLVIKEKESKDDTLPVTAVSILLILLASVTAIYLIWKKKRRSRESLEIDHNSNPSAIYNNSDVSLGLHSRSMVVENIYQVDTENEYEQWSR
ncbi:hypothetical protein QTP70_027974 [Hemibagrus guttatus]|uniref:Ig-like domain-containing protein n=1 Tax=Hemibagrus guttatus TaxID=175788 RepID=A0AAE0QLM3_9TELE|nr:hypothetical protein QTP70_027974 [Hemibagrus guttatus]